MRPWDVEFFRYFSVSPRDRRWGLYVSGVGRADIKPFAHSCPVLVHPDGYRYEWDAGRVLHEHQVIYITRGEGEFESASAGHRRVGMGSLIVLFPGEWHRYRPDYEVGYSEYWISFDGRYMEEWVGEGFLTPTEPVLRPGIDDAILRGYLELLELAQVEPTGFQQLAAANIHRILAAGLAAVHRERLAPTDEELVRQTKAMLEQRVEGVISIHKVAAAMGVSEEHLRRLFRAHAGMSPYQYYLELKIHRARQMLRETQLSLKEIAGMLHFEDPCNFSHAFKRHTGLSPSQWRNVASPET